MNGESELRLVELETGKVLKSRRLDAKDFGEGVVKVGGRCGPWAFRKHTLQAWDAPTYYLAVMETSPFQASFVARVLATGLHKRCKLCSRLVQLTWQSSKALSYAVEDLEDVQELRTPLSDGWGVTHTGGKPVSELIISDGSANLTVVDSKTLEKKNAIEVSSACRALCWYCQPTCANLLRVRGRRKLDWINDTSGRHMSRPRLPRAGEGQRQASEIPERAGMGEGRGLGQCVANRVLGAHQSQDR